MLVTSEGSGLLLSILPDRPGPLASGGRRDGSASSDGAESPLGGLQAPWWPKNPRQKRGKGTRQRWAGGCLRLSGQCLFSDEGVSTHTCLPCSFLGSNSPISQPLLPEGRELCPVSELCPENENCGSWACPPASTPAAPGSPAVPGNHLL